MTGVDLRLPVAVAAGWLALALCLAQPPIVAVWAAVIASVLGIAALLCRVRGARAVALAAACVVVLVLPFALRLAHARDSPLAKLAAASAEVTLQLTLDGDPALLSTTGPSGAARVVADGSVTAIVLDGRLLPPESPGALAVGFSTNTPPTLLGVPPWWQRAAGDIRDSLRSAARVLPAQERGLLPGLIDGDTSTLDPVLNQRFRVAGLTHLVAVSGTNCSILLGAVLLVLRRFRVRASVCALIGCLVVCAFVVVARPSPSVLRAAVMALIALVALASGRPKQTLPALAAAVLAILLYSPTLATSAGFTMSVLATASLVLLAPGWAAWLAAHAVPVVFAEGIAVAAAAHIVTAPVIAVISGQVSLIAIPANVLAEPAVAVVTVLGFLAATTAPLWLGGGEAFAWLAGWPCRWLVLVAEHAGRLDGATIPWPSGLGGGLSLLVAMLVLVFLARFAGPARWLAAIVLLVALLLVPVRSLDLGWPPTGWILVACDVGQGDGLVLPAGPGSAVVVDTGPDPVPMDRCLHDLGITRIPLLVLTHFHLDHVGGILGALHERSVGRVLVSPLTEPAAGVALVGRALAGRGVREEVPAVGASYVVGSTQLEILSPALPFHGTRSDPNNSSLVMMATVRGERVLLGADAEVEAQQVIMDARLDVHADVLKVPHHGSAYFDPAFLAAVHAKVAVISVGLHNDYGHPAPSLLAELGKLGVPVRRTDHDGTVAVVYTNDRLATVTHRPP